MVPVAPIIGGITLGFCLLLLLLLLLYTFLPTCRLYLLPVQTDAGLHSTLCPFILYP
jgi:hypothetical protein